MAEPHDIRAGGHENNHVHMLVNHPPKRAVTWLVNSLKSVPSRRMRQKFPKPLRHYDRANKLIPPRRRCL